MINDFICIDEKIVPANQAIITADNRGFRYGDGIFETLRCIDENIPLSSYHFNRLFKGLETLFFDIPPYYTAEYFTKQIIKLCKRNQHNPARVRLMIYRGNGGIKDSKNHFPHYIIQSWPLPNKQWQLNENGLILGLCKEVQKSYDRLSNLKHNNYLPYLYATHYAQQQKWNDAIILNNYGRISDTTIANIFMIKDKKIYTPPLTEGCIEGVARHFIIEHLSNDFSIFEKVLTIQDLENGDEIFLTNAIRGIQWVKIFNNRNYTNTVTQKIFEQLIHMELL